MKQQYKLWSRSETNQKKYTKMGGNNTFMKRIMLSLLEVYYIISNYIKYTKNELCMKSSLKFVK